MEIIGREGEKRTLQQYYESDKPEFVAVYGRRRTGKTFLVKEFFADRFSFYITGLANATKDEQLDNFAATLTAYGKTPYARAKDWVEAFRQLVHLLENDRRRSKKVIFIDELPWFDTPRSGFITGLEWFWNSWASTRPEILLIACGSATSWMLNKLLRNRGGLHNRVTHRMLIEPFTLAKCEAFFKHKKMVFERKDIVESYMIFGGIPFYLNMFEKNLSVSQNVDKLCFGKKSELKDEFSLLYSSLFKHADNYKKIIMALAKKKMGLTRAEIVSATGFADGGTLTKMLEELEQCSFIRSYNAYEKRSKDKIFQLVDFFSLFYLNFMKTAKQSDEHFWTNRIETAKHRAWSGYAFEQVCMQHTAQIRQKLGISGVVTYSAAWRSKKSEPAAQIDLLIERNDGIINICEMKYANDEYVIDKDYDKTLRNKRSAFKEETKTRKAVHITMITTFGLKHNAYRNNIQSEMTVNDLFRYIISGI
jgi:predicted AAA+ superfamily ATPase